MISSTTYSADLAILIKRYQKTRNHTVELMAPLNVEDYVAQPVVDVSPPKWHLGHTTWFFETMILKEFLSGYQVFNDRYAFYFNSYYEALGERISRDSRGALTRPPVKEIMDYRQYVDEHMEKFIQQQPDGEALKLIELGLQHEQQHQELFLTDFKFILGVQAFSPVYNPSFSEGKPEDETGWLKLEEGLYQVGFDGNGFCFDNELGNHAQHLEAFEIRQNLVTNSEWLEFVKNGGYKDFSLWHAEGWDWLKTEQIQAPLYWRKVENKWNRFTLSGLTPLELDHPVAHLSFYEAAAFCEWKDWRLPTEGEWEAAASKLSWGQRWEWTNSAYLPHPRYKKWQGAAAEYNGKFMINQMVLKGASIATSVGHSRKSYRNFFHPHLRWQFTGLRPVKNLG